MRGAIEWSYELLSEEERQLFSDLSVFGGGFTMDAAEGTLAPSSTPKEDFPVNVSVAGSMFDGGKALEVLSGISSLVDKSLLVSRVQSDGETRFRMLEVVREYALEVFYGQEGSPDVSRSHAGYFLDFGEKAAPHLLTEESVKWLDELEREHDNFRNALAWSVENDVVIAARIAAALGVFWTQRSHLTEAYRWFKLILERGGSEVPSSVKYKLHSGLGLAARFQGDYETARNIYNESLAEATRQNDKKQMALCTRGLGIVAHMQGDTAAAQKYFEEGLAISRELDDKYGMAFSLNCLGDLSRTEGEYEQARPLLDESLELFRQQGNKQGVCFNLNALGFVAFAMGDRQAAGKHIKEALTIGQQIGHKISISNSIEGFAALASDGDDLEKAVRLSAAAERLRETISYEMELAESRFRSEYLANLKAKIDESKFAVLYKEGRQMKIADTIAQCLGRNV
jgi:tetratricopeptide (TPR) repeat protein